MPMGAWGHRVSQYFPIRKKVGQKLARLPRGLATAFSVTSSFFSNNLVTIVGQWVRTPPLTEGVSVHQ